MLPLLGLLVYVGLGALAARWIFERKNRNPLNGTLLGALFALLTPPALLAFLAVMLIVPAAKDQPGGQTIDAQTGVETMMARLEEAKKLLDDDLIDEDEFKAMKAHILGTA